MGGRRNRFFGSSNSTEESSALVPSNALPPEKVLMVVTENLLDQPHEADDNMRALTQV